MEPRHATKPSREGKGAGKAQTRRQAWATVQTGAQKAAPDTSLQRSVTQAKRKAELPKVLKPWGNQYGVDRQAAERPSEARSRSYSGLCSLAAGAPLAICISRRQALSPPTRRVAAAIPP